MAGWLRKTSENQVVVTITYVANKVTVPFVFIIKCILSLSFQLSFIDIFPLWRLNVMNSVLMKTVRQYLVSERGEEVVGVSELGVCVAMVLRMPCQV